MVHKAGCALGCEIQTDAASPMRFTHRHAVETDLPRIVEIYNAAVATRTCSCDLDPITVDARQPSFLKHTPDHRPFWVAEDADAPSLGVVGYLAFLHFMNERPGYFITADLAIYLHPARQRCGLGSYLLDEAARAAPGLGIEVLTATIFATNTGSLRLFEKHGFERWGFMPRVARLDGSERDLVLVGRRLWG